MTSRILDDDNCVAGPSTSNPTMSSSRTLRKRRLNLNNLSSGLAGSVCEFPSCGVTLKDGESLEWHYEAHLGQEVEKLERLRIKKDPEMGEERSSRRRVRDSAVDRIRFNREKRLASKTAASLASGSTSGPWTGFAESTVPRCPVCSLEVDEVEFKEHLEVCLQIHEPEEDGDSAGDDDVEEDVDVDEVEGYETYTWAGHTRIRATSLVEGGLRGAGFMTITRGDEDAELDIENDDEAKAGLGSVQYTDNDVIAPSSETPKEKEERENLCKALVGDKVCKPILDNEETCPEDLDSLKSPEDMTITELQKALKKLSVENQALRQQTLCNICFDTYTRPVVSIVCWHVHCEKCWLRALGTKKLCPQCKIIIQPRDLRRIYL